MPKISVIMPIFNTNPKYLKQSIESILNQTFTDFEFLILNDSPKNTMLDDIVASYSDERIKYMSSKHNLGVAEAHNKLLKMAEGQYIAIMDHDDISLPYRLERQYAYMESHKEVGICGCAYKRFGRISKIKTIFHPEEHQLIQASLLFYCPIHHPSSLIRKSILDKYNICYDKRFISLNDRKLYFDISKHAKLHNLPDILYKYRFHSLMTSKIRREEIMSEQFVYRESLMKRYGFKLSKKEKCILNDFVFNGRCRIKDRKTLSGVHHVLCRLVNENRRAHYADENALKLVCGNYLLRRCKNAALRGWISSKDILERTPLPVKIPLWLKIFNQLRSFSFK